MIPHHFFERLKRLKPLNINSSYYPLTGHNLSSLLSSRSPKPNPNQPNEHISDFSQTRLLLLKYETP